MVRFDQLKRALVTFTLSIVGERLCGCELTRAEKLNLFQVFKPLTKNCKDQQKIHGLDICLGRHIGELFYTGSCTD